MKPYKCKAKACRKILGYVADGKLVSAAVADDEKEAPIMVDRRIVFQCGACGHYQAWGPVVVKRTDATAIPIGA